MVAPTASVDGQLKRRWSLRMPSSLRRASSGTATDNDNPSRPALVHSPSSHSSASSNSPPTPPDRVGWDSIYRSSSSLHAMSYTTRTSAQHQHHSHHDGDDDDWNYSEHGLTTGARSEPDSHSIGTLSITPPHTNVRKGANKLRKPPPETTFFNTRHPRPPVSTTTAAHASSTSVSSAPPTVRPVSDRVRVSSRTLPAPGLSPASHKHTALSPATTATTTTTAPSQEDPAANMGWPKLSFGLDFSISSAQSAWIAGATPAAPPLQQQPRTTPRTTTTYNISDLRAAAAEHDNTPSSSRTGSGSDLSTFMPQGSASAPSTVRSHRPTPGPRQPASAPPPPTAAAPAPRRPVSILSPSSSYANLPRAAQSEDGHASHPGRKGRSASITFLPDPNRDRRTRHASPSTRPPSALSVRSIDRPASTFSANSSSTTLTRVTSPSPSLPRSAVSSPTPSLSGSHHRTRKLVKRHRHSLPNPPPLPHRSVSVLIEDPITRSERTAALLVAAGLDPPPRRRAWSEDGHGSPTAANHPYTLPSTAPSEAHGSSESGEPDSPVLSLSSAGHVAHDPAGLALHAVTRDAGSSTAIAARVSLMLSDPRWAIGEEDGDDDDREEEDEFDPYAEAEGIRGRRMRAPEADIADDVVYLPPVVTMAPAQNHEHNPMHRWTMTMADAEYDEAVLREFETLRTAATATAEHARSRPRPVKRRSRSDVGLDGHGWDMIVPEDWATVEAAAAAATTLPGGVRADSVVYGGPGISLRLQLSSAFPTAAVGDREDRPRTSTDSGIELLSSAAHASLEDENDEEGWQSARRALLCCRELVRTETNYLEKLTQLLRGETETPPPPLMRRYLPELVRASELLLAALADDPSAWGIAAALIGQADTLERAFVPWCGAVGQWFAPSRRRATLAKRPPPPPPSRTSPSVPSSPTLSPVLAPLRVRKVRSRSKSRDPAGAPATAAAATSPPLMPSKRRSFSAWITSAPTTPAISALDLDADVGAPAPLPAAAIQGAPPATSAKRPTVRELAIQPTQRVMRYVLQYRDLLRHTPPTSPARALVERAVAVANSLAEKCDRAQGNALFLTRGA